MNCVVCGKQITYRFSLCAKCEEEYGRIASDQPEWLRFLINDDRKQKKQPSAISLEFVDEIMDFSDDIRITATYFREIYDIGSRPTEEEALDDKRD